MADLKILRKTVCLALVEALERKGFDRYRKECVDWPLTQTVSMWVGLGVSSENGICSVYPNIGIHAPEIDKIAWGNGYRRNVVTCSPTPLGSLTSISEEEPAFAFDLCSSTNFIRSESDRLAGLFRNNGIEAMQPLANYPTIEVEIKDCVPYLGGAPERYAACLYVNGKEKELIEHIEWCEHGEHSRYLSEFACYFRNKYL